MMSNGEEKLTVAMIEERAVLYACGSRSGGEKTWLPAERAELDPEEVKRG